MASAAMLVMVAIGCSGPSGMQIEETAAAEAAEPSARAAPPAIIPDPASIAVASGSFTVTAETPIFYAGGADAGAVAAQLSRLLRQKDAVGARPLSGPPVSGAITLLIDAATGGGPEGYVLRVSGDRITASARSPAGLFYAVQTLRQLLPAELETGHFQRSQTLTAMTIEDQPRFAWRGAMLDVARHFLKPADVKRFVDYMALYKLNRLHLHLADDQGWRIEIKSWPNLTAHGGSTAVGGGAGGYYTQAEYADIVEYARQRFITVVPEIDMPGHTNAALASYADLNCDGRARALYTGIRVGFSSLCPSKEITYRFVNDVVREIAELTPGPWFHVGGDEVKTLTRRQYAGFIERVQSIVQSHGKQMIGWGEIEAAALSPTTIVQHWQPTARMRAAVRQRARFILSPAHKVYLDMKYDSTTVLGQKWAAYVEVRDAYAWDPAALLPDVGESSIVGIEAPLWSETMVTLPNFEFLAFPRLPAVAEVAWSPQPSRDWDEFRHRLAAHAARWRALGINFYRSPQIPWQ